ncbi:HEXXH motif domain-containing protein [Phytohabitans rumicis]|uniref:HEXXH motif domain-containing protein n=1 Tax=Phytohabitans rumicis TaxID=1076125 RepID=A0A6V8L054_9ACTN|nr:HEXXH motif domain-containing protein [Phytohabitans rumicis]
MFGTSGDPSPDSWLGLPSEQFDALAAGIGGTAESHSLRRVEHSWRLLNLVALGNLADARADAVPLEPLAEAWALLARAQQAAPDMVDAIVMWPQVGIWAAYTMRRLRNLVHHHAPLWADYGYLHALAAVAGIQAGLSFTIRVPIRYGSVVLPSLGYVKLDTDAECADAELSVVDGVVRLTHGVSTVELRGLADDGDRPQEAWHPLPRITARAHGATISLILNDSDTYRDLREPAAPNALPAEILSRWEALLDEAWRLLTEHHPHYAWAIGAGLVSITPLQAAQRFRPLSASADQGFGAILSSEPEDAAQMAVTLIHEFQHNKLGALLHLLDLYTDRPGLPRIYAPWRDDPRPFQGVLQGVYAFVGICDFWRVHRTLPDQDSDEARLAQFEFALWRDRVADTLRRLSQIEALTPRGKAFVGSLLARAQAWQQDSVPPGIAADASMAADDHYSLWLAYHRQPDPYLVEQIVKAWQARQPRPERIVAEDAIVEDDQDGRYIDARSALIRFRLADPATLAALAEQGEKHPNWVSGADPADVVLVSGDIDRARTMYLARLAEDGGDAKAWTGLALALRTTDPSAAETIRSAPDVLRAVYSRIPPADRPDPLRLVAWMGERSHAGH